MKDTADGLAESAVPMPAFGDIGKDLEKEMNTESEEDRLKREETERLQREAEERAIEEERLRKEEEERLRLEEEERVRKEEEARLAEIERLRLEAEEMERLRLAEFERQRAEEEERQRRNAAATKIQTKYRGYAQKKEYKEKLERFKSAENLFGKVWHLFSFWRLQTNMITCPFTDTDSSKIQGQKG